MPSVDSIIVAENVSKEYGRGKKMVAALKDINLEIKRGEFIAILGPSGSGKSTLLNVLAGLDRPSKGRILIDGVDTTLVDERFLPSIRREKIGFVFQNFLLIEELNVMENVESPLWPTRLPQKEIEDRAMDLLRKVDLSERKEHFPRQLSGGEQQRTAIARALVNNPPILFCDEPTGNLDSKMGANIMKLISQLNKTMNLTVVLVTHNEELVKYAKRTIRMKDGMLIT